MRYVPYGDLDGRPNVIVDGSATAGTVLTLSHWPGSATPAALRRDLSAEIAFAYLEHPDLHVDAEFVSNNHLDEDGLVGVHALTRPDHAVAHRDRLIEIARAGDFSVTADRDAARAAFAIASLCEEPGASYESLLPELPRLVDDIGAFRPRWEEEDDHLQASLDAVAAGRVTVEEHPDLELSVVHADADVPLHPIAVHLAVRHFCVLTLVPGAPRLEDRYERWIAYASRRPRPRADLRPLAARLADEDAVGWRSGPPDALVVTLRPGGSSTLDPGRIRDLVVAHLRDAPPAFDPHAPAS